MALKDFFTRFFAGGEKKSYQSGTWQVLSGGGFSPNAKSTAELEQVYRGWAYACIHAKAEKVGSIQFDLKNNGEVVEKHPLLDLLYRVNRGQTKFELFYLVSAHIDIFGRAFVQVKKEKGETTLHVMQPDSVTPVYNDQNELIGYAVQAVAASGRMTKESVPAGEMIPFSDPYPFNQNGTFSLLQAAFDWLEGEIYASTWNKSFFRNAATPDGWITTTAPLGEEQQRRLLESLNQKYRGPQNVGKIGLLPHGTDYKPAGTTQKDMDFANLDVRYQDKILAIFRTPKSILGITNDVNRANAEASNYIYAANVIDPRMARIVDTLNEFLVPIFGDNLELGYVSPVPQDQAERRANITAALAGQPFMSINEARAEMGLPPLLSGGDIVGEGVAGNKEKRLVVAVSKAGKPEEKAAVSILETAAKQMAAAVIKSSQDDLHDDFVFRNLPHVKKMYKSLLKFNDQAERRFNESFDEIISRPSILLEGRKEVFFGDPKTLEAIVEIALPVITAVTLQEATIARAGLGITEQYVISNFLKETIKNRVAKLSTTYTGTMKDEVYQVIVDGLAAGSTPEQIRQTMNAKVFGGRNIDRAELVADTEIFRAANEGTLEGYRSSGVVSKKIWVTRRDERVCPFCGPLDGKEIGLEENFYNLGDRITADGSTLKVDYDTITAGNLHPRCRCWIKASGIRLAD